MKKKYLLIGVLLLALVITAVWAVPVFAAGPSNPASSTQNNQQAKRVVARLLLVQNEAKVNAFIAQAQSSGKITADQATQLKEFWVNNHQQFTAKVVAAYKARVRAAIKAKRLR